MKVVVKYQDTESLTIEEIVKRNRDLFGEGIEVKVYPQSNEPVDLIYFAISNLITNRQLELLYDCGPLYTQKLKELRFEILTHLEEELNQVIMDNETKVR